MSTDGRTQTRIRVLHDDAVESPREWDNLGVMACWHRRYRLGDEQPKCPPQDWFDENVTEGSVVLPLWLLDHSGITMSTGSFASDPAGWDSGQVGWIVATPEKIRENFVLKPDEEITATHREQVQKILESEVKLYASYLEGDCWLFVIEEGTTCDHGDVHWETRDSCGGFIGDDLDDMKEYVPEALRPLLEEAWQNRG